MIRSTRFLIACFVLISCGNKNKMPSGVLSVKQMEAVFWDILQTDAFTSQFQSKDSNSSKHLLEENAKLQQQVFALHKISRETFYKSYNYYKENSELMKGMLDSMISKANKRKGEPNRFIHPTPIIPIAP